MMIMTKLDDNDSDVEDIDGDDDDEAGDTAMMMSRAMQCNTIMMIKPGIAMQYNAMIMASGPSRSWNEPTLWWAAPTQ